MSKNGIINILLVEDDIQDCKIIKEYADTRDDVKLVKIANSSKEAIKDIKTYVPDAIILDIELNNGEGSGLQVLEQIKELDLDIKPVIVITTNISSKTVYAYAHSNGADLIFHKLKDDYSPELIIENILLLCKINRTEKLNKNISTETESEFRDKLSDRINRELNLIGISSHLKGREYIHAAIMYLIKEEDNGEGETVFNHLANTYKKSASSISRVMQTAINYAWRKSSPDDLEMYYTTKIDYNTGVPTPTELIYFYKDKILKDL